MNGWRRGLASLLRQARVEDALSLLGGLSLLGLFLGTSLVNRLQLGILDFCFILLPLLVLLFKVICVEVAGSLGGKEGGDDPETAFRAFLGAIGLILRDWFPFLILSATYFSLYTNFILRVNPHTADDFLASLDRALLGNQAAILLEPYIRPLLTDFLNLVYVSYLLYFPGVALFFYLYKERDVFRRIMMGYLVITFLGVLSYILVPAVGPMKHFAGSFTRDLQGQEIEPMVTSIISQFRVTHDCFPSLHFGIPLMVSVYLRMTVGGLWFLASLAYVGCIGLATVYLRYHYLVDILAAVFYVPLAVLLGDLLLARWPAWQRRLADRLDPEGPAYPGDPAGVGGVTKP